MAGEKEKKKEKKSLGYLHLQLFGIATLKLNTTYGSDVLHVTSFMFKSQPVCQYWALEQGPIFSSSSSMASVFCLTFSLIFCKKLG